MDSADRERKGGVWMKFLYLVRRLRPNARVMRGKGVFVCMQCHDNGC